MRKQYKNDFGASSLLCLNYESSEHVCCVCRFKRWKRSQRKKDTQFWFPSSVWTRLEKRLCGLSFWLTLLVVFFYFPPICIICKENLSLAACVFSRLLAKCTILANCSISNFENFQTPNYSRCALE